MSIELINLGTPPKGEDGDTSRTANLKCNNNFSELDTRATTAQSTADAAKAAAAAAKSTADSALPKAGGAVAGSLAVSGKLSAAGGTLQVGADTGNFWTVTYPGIVTRNIPSSPGTGAYTLSMTTSGQFGGGYGIKDGGYNIGLWSNFGNLIIGFGTNDGPMTGVCQISSNGNMTINGTLTQSDHRLKQVERELDRTEALASLMATRIVLYRLINDPSERLIAGVLAHELQEVIPDAVVGEKDGMVAMPSYDAGDQAAQARMTEAYQAVDYTSVFARTIAAIQCVAAKLEQQGTAIESLRQQLASTPG